MPKRSNERRATRRVLQKQRRAGGSRSLWPGSSLRSKGLMVIAIPLLPVTAAMTMLVLQAHQDRRADLRVTAIREAHEAREDLLRAAIDAETAIRGYVATGNPEFLDLYEQVIDNLPQVVEAFEEAHLPPEGEDLLADQYVVLKTLREEGGSASERRLESLLLRGKRNMDGIRSIVAAEDARRETQLSAAFADRERVHERSDAILWFGALGSVLGAGIGILLFAREIASRVKLLQQNSRVLDGAAPLTPIRGRDEIAGLGDALEDTRRKLAQKDALRREAESELIGARDEADRANAAKSEFLSRMSHELRTPLNAVLGFAQLLELDDLQPDQRDSVHQIVRGGKHLLDLINEVLDISRIESGRLSLSVEPVAIGPLVEETLALSEPLTVPEGITIRSALPPGTQSVYVMADQQRLKQIILNLVSNAIKYNVPQGSVDVHVSEEGDAVCLEIADTGPGLDEEQMRHLFTPFNRLGAEATGVEGTGLGLALSKRLAEAMGGDIAVTSRLGAGSTFALSLPKTDPPEAVTPTDAGRLTDAARRDGVATILYIEDNAANVDLVRSILARRPRTRLITALHGDDGIAMARQHDPDVILLDLNLPDIQGDEVLDVLRRDPRTSTTPIIMLSADATPRQIERLKAAGADAYLTKPLDVQRLLRVLESLLHDAVA